MATSRLTVVDLKSLGPEDVGRKITDEHSVFGIVRPRRDGVSVLFRWRYRLNNTEQDFTCGTWPNKTLAQIREARDWAKFRVAQGIDPNESKKIERLAKRAKQEEEKAETQARIVQAEALQARLTVNDLFERWASVELIRRKDGGKEIRRMFQKDVLPIIGGLAVEDVRKGHLTGVTDVLLARGVARMAKLIFSLMRQMFRYAVDRDIIENDPSAAIRKSRIGGKPTERDRVLSEDEVRTLHKQMPSARFIESTEIAIWLAFSTCCRIGELLKAEWKHVRLEAREWLIPTENSKNGKPHVVHLSDFAMRHFERLQEMKTSSKWCFPNRSGSDHVCVKTITKQIGDRQRGDADPMSRRSASTSALALIGGKWTPHDLRRTGATMMTALGVLPEVAEKCLNHTEESRVKRTYQRHNYNTQKKEAWDLLGERLELLTRSNENIVIFSSKSCA